MNFPLLTAQDIECRVSQVAKTPNGIYVGLLLYKDARVDMRILDETVGPMNWQREHDLINGNLFCTISIWDKEKSQWIRKQDVGTESMTEKEKGQASDAFKRAGFNVGIGRELYTGPRIRTVLADNEYDSEKNRVKPFVKVSVAEIDYNDRREIKHLVIMDNQGAIRFKWDG